MTRAGLGLMRWRVRGGTGRRSGHAVVSMHLQQTPVPGCPSVQCATDTARGDPGRGLAGKGGSTLRSF